MNASSWWVIKTFIGGTGAVFAVIAAILYFWDQLWVDQPERAQQLFGQRWQQIRDSGWWRLPEQAVIWVVRAKDSLGEQILERLCNLGGWYAAVTLGTQFLVVPVATSLTWGILVGIAVGLVWCVVLFVYHSSVSIYAQLRIHGRIPMWDVTISVVSSVLGAISLASAVLLIGHILRLSTPLAVLILAIIVPFFWISFAFLLQTIADYGNPLSISSHTVTVLEREPEGILQPSQEESPVPPVSVKGEAVSIRHTSVWGLTSSNLAPLSIAICASFVVTVAAILIGHTAEPNAWEPKTTRMLFSNVTFDGLTFWITMLLLAWAAKENTMRRIPGVILVDLVTAVAFACASLYIGLVATDKALSLPEILNVLIARDAQGNNWEVGPYFWTMHTAFLPTCAYLLLMFLAWLGKLILIPVGWFFRGAKGNPSPLKLTALLFGILVAGCIALFFAANTVHERAKEGEKAPASVSENNGVRSKAPVKAGKE